MAIAGVEALDNRLRKSLEAEGLAGATIDATVDYCRAQLVPSGADTELEARFRLPFHDPGYVIRDEDLGLLALGVALADSATSIGLGIAESGTVGAVAMARAVAQTGYSIYESISRIRKKAAAVTADEYVVYGTLLAIDKPASVAEISGVIRGRLDEPRIVAALNGLAEVRAPDDTVVVRVGQDGAGLWYIERG